jgi:hypothetical protein
MSKVFGFTGGITDSPKNVTGVILGATNARRAGREQRGNLRGGCVSKLCVD